MLQISCPMSKHLRYHKVSECNAADAISRKTGAPVYAGHTRDGRDRTTRLPQNYTEFIFKYLTLPF